MKFYKDLIDKINNNIPFKFSRWGDGEWNCMMGVKGKNRDGNEYFRELGRELRAIFDSRPDYYIGLQYGTLYNDNIRQYIFQKLFELNIDFVNGDIFHQASEFGQLHRFIKALEDKQVFIIGATYFKKLPYRHIRIPYKNSYFYNDILFRKLNLLKDEIYLVAAAMNSNVIIHRMPKHVTAIDIGSVLDPYLGITRATYQHLLKPEKLF